MQLACPPSGGAGERAARREPGCGLCPSGHTAITLPPPFHRERASNRPQTRPRPRLARTRRRPRRRGGVGQNRGGGGGATGGLLLRRELPQGLRPARLSPGVLAHAAPARVRLGLLPDPDRPSSLTRAPACMHCLTQGHDRPERAGRGWVAAAGGGGAADSRGAGAGRVRARGGADSREVGAAWVHEQNAVWAHEQNEGWMCALRRLWGRLCGCCSWHWQAGAAVATTHDALKRGGEASLRSSTPPFPSMSSPTITTTAGARRRRCA